MPHPEVVVEILTIGREILDGRVVDTNSIFMAQSLKTLGLVPRYGTRVDDDRARILEAFAIAAKRAQVVIATGGLGPTSDDITAEVFAEFLGERVAPNEAALAQLKERLAKLNRPLTDAQRKQVMLPPSCFTIDNPNGTAPGFGFDGNGTAWFFMPGVPREMKPMLVEHVLPRLPRVDAYRTRQWATHFVPEAALQERLTPLEKTLPAGFEVTYRTRAPENHIGLHGACDTPEREREFERAGRELAAILGDDVFSECTGTDPLPSLESIVVERLRATKTHFATVESCTAGLIAHRITEVPGASETFQASRVVYANEAKIELGVSPATLAKHGAVSPETARELAEGGLKALRALNTKNAARHWVVATTGIAGPGGGTAEKPVGLCHIALARSDGPTLHIEARGSSYLDRTLMKLFFSQKALDLVRRT